MFLLRDDNATLTYILICPISIGGDDNCKDDNEENREVISSSAKEEASSQFGREYLDGRKSFIFSCKK